MSYAKQIEWLASYDRETGSLSTYAARECGYGDMLKMGYVTNRGPDEMPDLFITGTGIQAVALHSRPITKPIIGLADLT